MRKLLTVALLVCAVLSLGVMPADADGRGRHRSSIRSEIWIGAAWDPFWGYYPYSYPYPYAPYYAPPIVIEKEKPIFFEAAPQKEEPIYWYYCKDAKAYYPYVKECPGGWKRVRPYPVPDNEPAREKE